VTSNKLIHVADLNATSIRTVLCTSTVMGSRAKRRNPIFSTSILYWARHKVDELIIARAVGLHAPAFGVPRLVM